ncbi:MAG: ATP-binding protein, partial [Bacteroidota bacterium]|nr:ATP-binding protein [Bacteroidota bacterium]
RVIQEAVNNALKYAEAPNIQVTMQVWDADQFKVAVVDDGNGFDLKNHKQGNGLGNMKKRAQDIGATLQIETQPTQGTRVILQSK